MSTPEDDDEDKGGFRPWPGNAQSKPRNFTDEDRAKALFHGDWNPGDPGTVTIYDSEPAKFTGFGEFKRSIGDVICPRGTVKFDGTMGGSFKITIECGTDDAKQVIDDAIKALS